MQPKVEIGGILKYKLGSNQHGYGFKTVFKTSEEAQSYKEMMYFILRNDHYKVNNGKGYYDKKEEE